MLFDDSHDSDQEPSSPQLQEVPPAYQVAEETEKSPSPEEGLEAPRRVNPRRDRSLPVLFGQSYSQFHAEISDSSSETVSNGSPAMTEQVGVGPATRADVPASDPDASIDSRLVDAKALGEQAAAALATEAIKTAHGEPREQAKRVDSAHDDLPQSAAVKQSKSDRQTSLKLHTCGPLPGADETIATSPRLARHAIPVEEGNAGTLPALQPISPTTNGISTSPRSEKLPSFRQLTELADAATHHENRVPQYSHHHSQSLGSGTAQSPVLPYHIPPTTQMSPSSQYTFSARSPTSTIGDHYSSPTQYPGNAYYMERRTSAIHEQMGLPPSLPSASSSGESHGPASSSTDGYSTSHTTPIDSAVLQDGMQRSIPILPPPRGMPPQSTTLLLGGFKCDYPGCEALPFSTQYLLRYITRHAQRSGSR